MAFELGDDLLFGVLAVGGLCLLGLGYAWKGKEKHLLRVAGWMLFGLYWPTQSASFFNGTEPDPVNGYFTLLAPLAFAYVAYHEYRSWKWGEDPSALRWLAGTAFIAGATYFAIYKLPGMTDLTIGIVAQHSAWVLSHVFGVPSHVFVDGSAPVESRYNIFIDNSAVPIYAVTIILACTAIQSIMIFVGAIATTEGAAKARMWKAIAYTAPPIYVLNLFRNAGIVWGYKVQGFTCCGLDSFEFWHSYVGKGGSLLALILIALAVFKTLPELHQHILDLFDLPKRRKPGFFTRVPAPEAGLALPLTPQPQPESGK
ncbi:MAG: archaeosortase A [Halobacteriales archaeon]|nr:archaeosortase A [Halobacteriales archaeon]